MFEQLLLLAQLSTSTHNYMEAKTLADIHEESLPAEQTSKLLASQGKVAGIAFSACLPTPPPQALPSFTIVMQLNATGNVSRTWLKSDSDFAKCVEREFSAATFFRPPSAPFFTSFEFKFRP